MSESDDRWERMARESAMALPPSDYGSTRAIHDVARLLRHAYQLGREGAKSGTPWEESTGLIARRPWMLRSWFAATQWTIQSHAAIRTANARAVRQCVWHLPNMIG